MPTFDATHATQAKIKSTQATHAINAKILPTPATNLRINATHATHKLTLTTPPTLFSRLYFVKLLLEIILVIRKFDWIYDIE